MYLHQREAAKSPTEMPSKFHAPRELKFDGPSAQKIEVSPDVKEGGWFRS
jgi:hypothetical protein